jgi:hypothetical protein
MVGRLGRDIAESKEAIRTDPHGGGHMARSGRRGIAPLSMIFMKNPPPAPRCQSLCKGSVPRPEHIRAVSAVLRAQKVGLTALPTSNPAWLSANRVRANNSSVVARRLPTRPLRTALAPQSERATTVGAQVEQSV